MSKFIEDIVSKFYTRYPILSARFSTEYRLHYLVSPQTSLQSDTVAVIPPSDYWVMQADLNVRSEKEATRYAAGLFDLGAEYRYEAQKTTPGHFALIAYSPEQLARKWPNVFGGGARRLTFAQWVFGDISYPIRLGDGVYLSSVENNIIEVEGAYIDENSAVDMQTAILQIPPSYKTVLSDKIGSGTLSSKTLATTFIVSSILLANAVFNIVLTNREIQALEEKKEELSSKFHLPSTSIEREVIIESLKHKEEKQLKLRSECYKLKTIPIKGTDTVAAVSKPSTAYEGIVLIPGSKPGDVNQLLLEGNPTALSGGEEYLQELNYDGNTLKILVNTYRGEALKKEFSKRFKKGRIDLHNHMLEIRIK